MPLELSSGQGGSSTKWPWIFLEHECKCSTRPFLAGGSAIAERRASQLRDVKRQLRPGKAFSSKGVGSFLSSI